MPYAALHVHTFYSLHRSIVKPKALARAAADLGIGAVAMTDYGNLGAAVDFVTAMKEQGVRPILGCEFSLCRGPDTERNQKNARPYSHCIILAKNLAGWKQLLLAVSRAASREVAYEGPRLNLETFREFAGGGDLIAISGYMGSDIADVMFDDPKATYAERDPTKVRGHVRGVGKANEWRADGRRLVEQYISIFGQGNFFLSVEQVNLRDIPATGLIAGAVRQLGARYKVPRVATPNTHYLHATPREALDQRVLLLSGMQTTMKGLAARVLKEPDNLVETFFGRGEGYDFPGADEMRARHEGHEEEVEQSGRIAEMCEDYNILNNPQLPHFPCPDGMGPEGYLRELCERGWRDKIEDTPLPQPIQVYRDRLEMELGVINGAGLPSYFLIVQDFMNYGKGLGWICGPGRGSGAGCIISYLTGITGIDPIEYGLIFERFYNAGRNAPGRVSLPDIDCDIPKYKREEVYKYLQEQYGEDKVAKIATFSSMQGRSALTAVLSVHDEPFDTVKRITKMLPDKARISEELEEMRLRGEEPSVIGYSLDILANDLIEWVQIEERGEERVLTGTYARRFEQAMRLEGTKTHIGMHAAGVVIGAEPLAGVCPMKWDATHQCYVAAMEFPALEALGLPKIDVLGIAMLDKAQGVRDLVRTGRISE